MAPITNRDVYTNGMKRAMLDKLFWVDKIGEPTMIVDFGCADGSLMCEVRDYFPDVPLLGVDNDEVMRDEARDNGLQMFKNLEDINTCEGSVLVLSSVLHELYSYCTTGETARFWEKAREFDTIVIRDMAVNYATKHYSVPQREAEKIRKLYPEQARDFEESWGYLNMLPNYLHFLLKYRYRENWNREVLENYLPNTMESLTHIAGDNRDIVYHDHYVLPFLKNVWHNDLGVEVDTPTHLKLITRKS